jgi:virulence-associated protein VapD
MKLDIKTLITIITFAATMGGFYYSTQIRLDHLEAKVQQVEKQIKQIKKRNRNR